MLVISESDVFSCDNEHAVQLRIAASAPCDASAPCASNSHSFRSHLSRLSSGLPPCLLQALQPGVQDQSRNLTCTIPDAKPDVQQQLHFERCIAEIPHCPCTHQLIADAGFICMTPPLPLQLLSLLGTADLSSLGMVSKALRCVTNNQATREDAAWWRVKHSHTNPSTGTHIPQKCTHMSMDQSQDMSSGNRGGSNSSDSGGSNPNLRSSSNRTEGVSSGGSSNCGSSSGGSSSGSSSLIINTPSCNSLSNSHEAYSLKDKQRMRCLSIRLGSPKTAAEQLVSMDTKHRHCTARSDSYPNDAYINLMKRFADMGGDRVEVLEVQSNHRCTLYTIAAQHVHSFSDSIFGTGGAIEDLQDVVDAAAAAGRIVYLLHTAQ